MPLVEDRKNNVVVVRHGETEWSRYWRHTGRTDVDLTDEGREGAEALRGALAPSRFSLVLTSPLVRAQKTAELAGFQGAEVDEDLLEWDYGAMEGLTTPEIRESRPGWTVWSGEITNGESIDEVAARGDRVIERCLAADGDVLLFGHGHALRIFTARWCELAPAEGKRFMLFPATPSELGWEHEYRTIRHWNPPV